MGKTYKYGPTESTPYGEVRTPTSCSSFVASDVSIWFQSRALGSFLHGACLGGSGDARIPGISAELTNLKQVYIRIKVGSEGTAVFDSATALLQGLFPPTHKNRKELTDGTVIVAPLNGYQYIPGMR